jgi:hypothetical protein
MNSEREAELIEIIEGQKHLSLAVAFKELLSLRRERYRTKLEAEENPLARGRAKECKDLTELLS